MLAAITDKGQITVSTEIHDRLDIPPGTQLEFESLSDEALRVWACGSANRFGLPRRDVMKAWTVEKMDGGIVLAESERRAQDPPNGTLAGVRLL